MGQKIDSSKLNQYSEWLKTSPDEILLAVKAAGGWTKVFPDKLPLWAHRVRNYFNQEPKYLTLFEADAGENMVALLHEHFKKWGRSPEIAETQALSDDVYKDENGRKWYQMSPGGTIYHFGRDPVYPKLEAVYQTLKTQTGTPVFKLVSPDGTGGSCETILENRPVNKVRHGMWTSSRERQIGEVGKPTYVLPLNVTDAWYKGSYNYAETVDAGFPLHKRYDVEPHEANHYRGIYVDPPYSLYVPLSTRTFPINDGDGRPLASQI